ncbi:MAG: hypothetical protein K1Y01_17490 [Vicinamibacteria bacterium]|nr:hypothetical protein [Vicinamibacteria bacterium]
MWILFRVVVAAAAFAARLTGRFRRRRGVPTAVGDATVLLAQRTGFNREVHYSIGVDLEASVWFRLQRETDRDRWFKRVGLATEIQTGDEDFDKFVYVVSDHPMFASLLERSKEARGLISELLWAGITRIEYGGGVLWCSMKRKPSEHELSLVARLGKAMAPLQDDSSSPFADPFLRKALAIEGVVWSIAAYAGSSLLVTLSLPEIYLTDASYLLPGLCIAAGLFALLLAGVAVLMRGSSRGHRLVIESAVVLAFALPCAGIQIFDDVNRGLDSSEVKIRTNRSECQKLVSVNSGRRRGPRTTVTHWLHVSGSGEGITLPSPVRFPGQCEHAPRGALATFTIGRGALGGAWYRTITVGDFTWSPP